MRLRAWVGGLFLGLGLCLLIVPAARAVITKNLPLGDVIDDSLFIFTVKVEKFDPDNQRMFLVVDEHLKGKGPFTKLPVVLKGDEEADKGKHGPQLLKRLANDVPLVLFVWKRDERYYAFGYTNGTWLQMSGTKPEGADSVRWSFAHLEPYLRRTFKGTTVEMKQTVADVLQGKRKPPESNEKEEPGFGPEVPDKKQGTLPLYQGPVFGVIPSVLVGGPLAVLSMLFPTLFGGWKRWLAFISVVCSTSTVYFLHWWLSDHLVGTVWNSPLALWLALTAVTFLGSVWAWLRFVRLVEDGQAGVGNQLVKVPGKVEVRILAFLGLVGLGVLAYALFSGANLLEVDWLQVLVIAIGAWTATAYALAMRWRGERPRPALPTEVVMLSAMVLTSTVLAGTQRGPSEGAAGTQTSGTVLSGATAAESLDDDPVQKGKVAWTNPVTNRGRIFSTPLFAGDRVYVAVAHEHSFAPYGAIHCLNSKTGETIWVSSGDKDKQFKMISISSPALAEGRLYVGEGFHQDALCRLTCLDAETGKWLWDFKTESHVESSPRVADGRVYFGAGDDGVYCLDAETGKRIWQCPGLHVDSTPLVHQGRVYAGSGVGDKIKDASFAVCLDAKTGERLWEKALDYPAWGSPVLAGKLVCFGIGKGQLDLGSDYSEGALLALKTEDGEEAWRVRTDAAVLRGAVVDRSRVYFGTRDGLVLAVDQASGTELWKRKVGRAVFASPALARSQETGGTTSVYVLSAEGQVFCLGPRTGKVYWSHNLAESTGSRVELMSSPAVQVLAGDKGQTRRVVFGVISVGATRRSPSVVCMEDQVQPEGE